MMAVSRVGPRFKPASRRLISCFQSCMYDSELRIKARVFTTYMAIRKLQWIYSYRRATSGSTFVARQAGTKQASSATAVSNNAMLAKVAGSVALTP